MVSLRCACGEVRGHAEVATALRLVCYCDDCQRFARWLGRDDVQDAQGGTDIIQVAPAMLAFDQGFDRIAIGRLSPKGLLRSYAGCCRTPTGNLVDQPRMPFVGVPLAFVAPESRGALPASVGGVMGRFAVGGCPHGAHPKVSARFVARTAATLLGRAIRRQHRPSPFFGPGGLTVAPHAID
jgi:hypothetical protein